MVGGEEIKEGRGQSLEGACEDKQKKKKKESKPA